MMIDFKFDALYKDSLHRELPEVGLVEKVSGSLYWWVELGVPFLHREVCHPYIKSATSLSYTVYVSNHKKI